MKESDLTEDEQMALLKYRTEKVRARERRGSELQELTDSFSGHVEEILEYDHLVCGLARSSGMNDLALRILNISKDDQLVMFHMSNILKEMERTPRSKRQQ